MKNIYKKLTKEQKERGVVFSSTLSNYRTEQPEDTIHEVFNNSDKKELIISRLKDAGFFSDYKLYNIIRN